MTTREDYFNQDITDRLKGAISELVPEELNQIDHNVIVFQEGIGVHISDVMHDAIVEIKRLSDRIKELEDALWLDPGEPVRKGTVVGVTFEELEVLERALKNEVLK